MVIYLGNDMGSKMILKRNVRMLISCLVVALVAPLAQADEQSAKIGELKKKRDEIKTLHIVGTSNSSSSAIKRDMRIETWEKNSGGKHKLRREVTSKASSGTSDERSNASTLVIKDGTNAWREVSTPEKKMVFRSASKMRTEFVELEKIAENRVIKIREGESFLNIPCTVIEVRHKANPDDVIATYWISTEHGVVLKSTVKGDRGTLTEWTATEVKINEEISDTRFDYKPPADAQVIEEKMGGRGD